MPTQIVFTQSPSCRDVRYRLSSYDHRKARRAILLPCCPSPIQVTIHRTQYFTKARPRTFSLNHRASGCSSSSREFLALPSKRIPALSSKNILSFTFKDEPFEQATGRGRAGCSLPACGQCAARRRTDSRSRPANPCRTTDQLWVNGCTGYRGPVCRADEIANAIAVRILTRALAGRTAALMRRPPDSLSAWETYQRGVWHRAAGGRRRERTGAQSVPARRRTRSERLPGPSKESPVVFRSTSTLLHALSRMLARLRNHLHARLACSTRTTLKRMSPWGSFPPRKAISRPS